MGVTIRKRQGKWWVFVNYHGRRKAKCVGSREAAEQVRRRLEARLTLGDLNVFRSSGESDSDFDTYADRWIRDYARIECKKSTADNYEGVLRQYLRPRFGKKLLKEIKRDDIKALINDLVARKLSRNTICNALCVIRGLLNYADRGRACRSKPGGTLGPIHALGKVDWDQGDRAPSP